LLIILHLGDIYTGISLSNAFDKKLILMTLSMKVFPPRLAAHQIS